MKTFVCITLLCVIFSINAVAQTMVIRPAPTANAGMDAYVNYPGSAVLTATGGGSYVWSTGETTSSIKVSPSITTVYTVTVTSSNGCTATDDVTVSVKGSPLQIAVDRSVRTIIKGDFATLSAISSGGTAPYSYVWSTGEVLPSITVSPTVNTYYTVTVTDTQSIATANTIVIVQAKK